MPASPTPSDPPASTGTPTSLPQPVERPCLFKGKDLNDYKSIVESFDRYFNGLSANVLNKQYKAKAADLAPLDQTADLLIARLRAGDVRQVSSGINVVEDMDSIIDQVNAIIEAALKAEPDLSPDMSQAALNSSLDRQRSRLQRVAVICIQRIAAG